jgi:hypothetical protein
MKYQYRAIKQGQIVKGDIEAKNKEKAIEVLKSNKIVILDVKPKKNPIFSSDALFNRVSFNEIVNLTRHFSIMLNAGLTITDSARSRSRVAGYASQIANETKFPYTLLFGSSELPQTQKLTSIPQENFSVIILLYCIYETYSRPG